MLQAPDSVFTCTYIYIVSQKSSYKPKPQGHLLVVCRTFVTALAPKVPWLAKKVRLTVADAVDTLSRQENST